MTKKQNKQTKKNIQKYFYIYGKYKQKLRRKNEVKKEKVISQ